MPNAEGANSSRNGRCIGPYRLESLLGAGGMGEVYRARDARLGRDVAIKVLPQEFTRDRERLARFEHEARVLAALNHPHIGAIYGIEEAGDVRALVLEFVDGETLAHRIRRGPVPVTEALAIARQIAEALDAAHKKGIIHRDLKPANVQITPEGAVKVLDFGLAKAVADGSPADFSHSPTLTVGATRQGVLLGTAAYMSPEQARARPVDTRTDIWAFGCVLYELLTGRPAFEGETVTDTLARVLEREPDWGAVPGEVPASIRDLLRRCLRKDAAQRPQNVADLQLEIDRALTGRDAPRVSNGTWITALATVAIAAALAAFLWNRSDRLVATDVSRWEQLTDFSDVATQPALSADGRMLAFIRGGSNVSGQLYVKLLPDGEPVPLTDDDVSKLDPAFSPEGTRLAYTVNSGGGGAGGGWDTWVVPTMRGEPRLWLRNASGLTWTGPGRLLFSEIKSGIHMGIVAATDTRGDARDIYVPADSSWMAHRSAISPDGGWVLVAEMDARGVFIPCRVLPSDGSSAGRQVGPPDARCTHVAWAPDGRWMYFTADPGDGFHVWRQRFPNGQPERITGGPTQEGDGLAISPDGDSLVTSVGVQRRAVWIHDASGERQISGEGYAFWPLFSDDGQTLCYRLARGVATGQSPSELWKTDLRTGRSERLLPGRTVTQYDLRDDRIVAAVPDENDTTRLWTAWLDGREEPKPVDGGEADNPRLGAGNQILFRAPDGDSMALFRIGGDGTRRQKVASPPGLGGVFGRASPDGRWISALAGNVNTMWAVPTDGGAAPVRVLSGNVSRLRWSPDGARVYVSIQVGEASGFGFGRTYVLPTQPGSILPGIPEGGFRREEELAAAPGVEMLPYGDLAPGPTPGTYAFSRITATRNLYRIPLR